jgi:hypothetical protein
MNALEELLRAHLRDVREKIAAANASADALERQVEKIEAQLASRASLQPIARPRLDGWSAEEDALLREHYPLVGAAGCVELLPHRTAMAIRVRASRKLKLAHLPSKRIWCSQCEAKVTADQAATCASQFCKAKAEVA